VRLTQSLVVRGLAARKSRGQLVVGGRQIPCALGRTGRRTTKREGDGATPIGCWDLISVLYRADRVQRPKTALPVRVLRLVDGWCDAVGDRNYNRQVRHPYPASAETLWRDDHLYDVIVVLNHNSRPRVQGAASPWRTAICDGSSRAWTGGRAWSSRPEPDIALPAQ
jgi:L,D-peptidoglycan transpeptidase YkuD (ErfK/YbiS/YcfS/YnhG family)